MLIDSIHLISETSDTCSVWGKIHSKKFQTKLGCVTLEQFKSGYSFSWDNYETSKIERKKIERRICSVERPITDYAKGVKIASIIFDSNVEGHLEIEDYPIEYTARQASAMAKRAIALLGQLPTQQSAEKHERSLTIANDYPVHIPHQGWIECLKSYVI